MNDSLIYYTVGALLYCPANNNTIAGSIIHESFGSKYSLALCLEDTIHDAHVAEAEEQLIHSLSDVYKAAQTGHFFIPKIFIRVRNFAQIKRLLEAAGDSRALIRGFILPKFSLENADRYLDAVNDVNSGDSRYYMMPIFEDHSLADLRVRPQLLYTLKEKLDQLSELVLNIRVGGNDLCNLFGFRRHRTESIYDIRPVCDILSDIVTVFGQEYLVSGPVWEYYSGMGWDTGFRKELAKDRIFGFIGKTVIHPKQIALVNEAYAVTSEDYNDSLSILGWEPDNPSLVSGSAKGERMNEYKTHYKWAVRTKYLAEYYGTV